MAKIVLDTVTGGYDLSVINNNFDKIETEFQNKVLYRDNPVGEVNTLQTDVDANSKRLYNLPAPTLANEAARLQDIQGLMNGLSSLVQFTPYKNISSINLQAAIQEEIDDLESTAAGRGASLIGIQDVAAKFTGTTVETALAETRTSAELSAIAGGSLIGFTPYSNIAATTVQAALQEEIDDLANTTSGASLIGVDGITLATFLRDRNNKVVDSITALKAIDKTKFTRVFVTGYYTAGDGGGGHYWFDPSDVVSTDNGGTVIVATDGGRWKLILVNTLSVKQFGAKGDGIANDSPAIQAAIDYIEALAIGSSQGRQLRFPAGHYLLTSGLTVDDEMVLIGDGGESTKFQIGAGTIFTVSVGGVHFRDLFFLGPTGVSSNGIKLINGNNCTIERCTFQNQTTGVELQTSYAVEIIGCIFDVCYTYGVFAGTSAHNLMIERCGFFTCGVTGLGHAINLNVASDNIGIKDNDFEFCYVNVRLNGCNSVEITGNYFEFQSSALFDFAGTCTGVIIESNWIALGSGAGATQVIQNITGGRFVHNRVHDQTISFSTTTLVGFDVGINLKTGTGTLGGAPWIAPTLLNSWAQQANHTTVGYLKDANGWVNLRGALVGGTAPNTLFQLPVGYRPAAIAVFGNDSASGPGRITINTDGTVVPTVAASNNSCIDGIRFYVG